MGDESNDCQTIGIGSWAMADKTFTDATGSAIQWAKMSQYKIQV